VLFTSIFERSQFDESGSEALVPVDACFALAYAGIALAAPVAPFPGKSDSVAATQAQPEKPVDCKKTPKDPSCKKKQ